MLHGLKIMENLNITLLKITMSNFQPLDSIVVPLYLWSFCSDHESGQFIIDLQCLWVVGAMHLLVSHQRFIQVAFCRD